MICLPEPVQNSIYQLFYFLFVPDIWSIPIWANPFPISMPLEAAFATWSGLGAPGICGGCGNGGCAEMGSNTQTISTNTKANNLKILKFILVAEIFFTLQAVEHFDRVKIKLYVKLLSVRHLYQNLHASNVSD